MTISAIEGRKRKEREEEEREEKWIPSVLNADKSIRSWPS
jgi:hypothetical protein